MTARTITPEQLRTAKRMYVHEGASTHTIASHLKIGQETVRSNLIAAGVTMRSPADGQRAAAQRRREMAQQRSAQA